MRLSNVGGNSFTHQVWEPFTYTVAHALEDVYWMVAEVDIIFCKSKHAKMAIQARNFHMFKAGSYSFKDGRMLQAGTLTSSAWVYALGDA